MSALPSWSAAIARARLEAAASGLMRVVFEDRGEPPTYHALTSGAACRHWRDGRVSRVMVVWPRS